MTFAKQYYSLWDHLMTSTDTIASISCRGQLMAKEMTPAQLDIAMQPNGVSVFSQERHRVVPIRFVLAELCYLLSGSCDLELIASYSATMRHYSNDGKTNDGAYGFRLALQLPRMLERLRADPQTRQACGVIFREPDAVDTRSHIPCNVFLQLLWRDNLLSLHVTSRSSDFVTGFSIDTLHWQFLLCMFACELNTVADHVIYNIASLHIYERDMKVVEAWETKCFEHPFEWFLKTNIPISRAIERCQRDFKQNMSVNELAELLEFDDTSLVNITQLDQMFRQYRNKIER